MTPNDFVAWLKNFLANANHDQITASEFARLRSAFDSVVVEEVKTKTK